MIPQAFEEILARTLDDGHLSRAEQLAVRALAADLDPAQLPALRSRVFAAAKNEGEGLNPGVMLDWVEGMLKALMPEAPRLPVAEALFSPGEDCRRRLVGLFETATQTADVCVFTITDDTISRAVFEASRRGVAVRIITDDEKAHDLGSDVADLEHAGVLVRRDRSPAHMHHKFALFDGRHLASGSYNWTRSAAMENEENLIVTDHPDLVRAFHGHFEQLWKRLA